MSLGKSAVELATDLAAGLTTEKTIKQLYGDTMLSTVLGIGSGIAVGYIADAALKTLDRETSIVSDLGSLVDDVLDLF